MYHAQYEDHFGVENFDLGGGGWKRDQEHTVDRA